MQIIIQGLSRSHVLNFIEERTNILAIKECIERIEGIPVLEQRITLNSKPLCDDYSVTSEVAYELPPFHLSLRLLGGKGGFGALLRGQGAKAGAKRTTNFDDCRDLNGNRIRNLKNEKKLSDWYDEQQKKKDEEERKKKTEVVKVTKVTDAKYTNQLKENEEVIAQSLEKGLQEAKRQQELKKLQKTESDKERVNKKPRLFWDPYGEEEEDQEEELKAFSDSVIASKNADNEDSSPVEVESASTTITTTSDTEEPPVDLNEYDSAEQLEALGLDKLKNELTKQGLPCGGTLKERAQRLFNIKGKSEEEIEQMKKGGKSKKRKGVKIVNKDINNIKRVEEAG